MPEGLSHNTVTAIAQDGNAGTANLWLGTNGGGLQRFHGAISPALRALAHALPSTIYGILVDGQHRLWLSAPTGIYRVAAGDPAGESAVTEYGTADGMNIRECSGGGHPTAWKLADGSLWFATLDGVSSIDPEHTPANSVAPPVVIEKVLVDDRPQPMDQRLTMQPGANRLEFQYAGLSFQAPQKVHYRYSLEGFDRGWIDAGTRRGGLLTPTCLPVITGSGCARPTMTGFGNEVGASFGLRLLPHYYQTYWFYAALLWAAGLLGYLAYRWRVRQVEAQFGAVLAERGRLAREIHDTLAQGYVGISVQLELVARLLQGASAAAPRPALDQLDQARALVRDNLGGGAHLHLESPVGECRGGRPASTAHPELPSPGGRVFGQGVP